MSPLQFIFLLIVLNNVASVAHDGSLVAYYVNVIILGLYIGIEHTEIQKRKNVVK